MPIGQGLTAILEGFEGQNDEEESGQEREAEVVPDWELATVPQAVKDLEVETLIKRNQDHDGRDFFLPTNLADEEVVDYEETD